MGSDDNTMASISIITCASCDDDDGPSSCCFCDDGKRRKVSSSPSSSTSPPPRQQQQQQQRWDDDDGGHGATTTTTTTRLADLPDETLAIVSNFLPKFSAAFLAVAVSSSSLSSSSSSWHHHHDEPIIAAVDTTTTTTTTNATTNARDDTTTSSSIWETLDFGELEEKSTANNLTDSDLRDFLLYIDAATVVKKMKLVGCIHITGTGLEPLKKSCILEQLDLSTTGEYENARSCPQPEIREDVVAPILEGIIADGLVDNDPDDGDGCGYSSSSSLLLRHLHLPEKWSSRIGGEGSGSGAMAAFLKNYETFLRNRRRRRRNRPFECAGCVVDTTEEYCRFRSGSSNTDADGGIIHRGTCYSCLDSYCDHHLLLDNDDDHDHRDDDGRRRKKVDYCGHCRRSYCTKCVIMEKCMGCHKSYCRKDTTTTATRGCMTFERCDGCDDTLCEDCRVACDRCSKVRCAGCSTMSMYRCRHCGKRSCVVVVGGDGNDDGGCGGSEAGDGGNIISSCDTCGYECCYQCRLGVCLDELARGDIPCMGCTVRTDIEWIRRMALVI